MDHKMQTHQLDQSRIPLLGPGANLHCSPLAKTHQDWTNSHNSQFHQKERKTTLADHSQHQQTSES